jgi:hypothetical protein
MEVYMAIRVMVSKEYAEKVGFKNIEIVNDYPGHEITRVSHCSRCANRDNSAHTFSIGENCCRKGSCGQYCFGCSFFEPLYMETSHSGMVLYTSELNGRDDSDFLATFWNEEKGQPEELCYASTRGWTYPNSAWRDATPEIQAKYDSWRKKREEESAKRARRESLMKVQVGKPVRVHKGRKVPIGTEGKVFWVGPCKFRRGSIRVGMECLNGERVYLDSDNVVVLLSPEQQAEIQ